MITKRVLILLTMAGVSLWSGCNSQSDASQTGETGGEVLVFNRVTEPNERAFSLLVPTGWKTEGGIYRVDPTAAGGAAQSIAAKVDFAVKSDNAGSVMVRWLPDVLFYDASMSPAGQMGMFPPGSNYNGMTVFPKMSATQFIIDIAFPYAHPGAEQVAVVDTRSLPGLAQSYTQRVRQAMPYIDFTYDAAAVTLNYTDQGKTYTERMIAVVEDWGQLGAGMWGNKETALVRAPTGQLDRNEKTLGAIHGSVTIDRRWLAGELQGQIKRGEIALNTQREVQQIENAIVEHRQKTNAEINNDMFLTLTEQEEYVNPYTNEVEYGSNQWQHRWVSESGEVIYTDNEDYDPNVDINRNRSDFKRTQIRKRFGE